MVLSSVVAALYGKMVERKQEAKQYPLKLVEIAQDEPDSAVWGKNFPHQFESLSMTKEILGRTQYGGPV